MAPDGEPGTAATGRHEASFAAFFAVVLDGEHVTLSRTYIPMRLNNDGNDDGVLK